jgi:hypothetical protein
MRCLEDEVLAGQILSDPFEEAPAVAALGYVASMGTHSGDELFKVWCEMVENYSRRSLTNPSDILIAIALAREFHNKHGLVLGEYAAGIWRHYFRSGLLWRAPSPEEGGQEVKEAIQNGQSYAPSWSWASIVRPVVFLTEPETVVPLEHGAENNDDLRVTRWYCDILSYMTTQLSDLDPFGALKVGVLEVRGPLVPLCWRAESNSNRIRSIGVSSVVKGFELLAKDTSILRKAGEVSMDIDIEPSNVPDGHYSWLGVWYAGRGCGRGLILQRRNAEEFERVGYAEMGFNGFGGLS